MDRLGASIMKAARTPSPTKQHTPFLTKDSNVRNFVAWDVDERLRDVEHQFRDMKEVMNNSLTDKKKLEEAIDHAKTRGMSMIPRCV